MPRMIGSGLSRREREILEVLHRAGGETVSATEVAKALADPPSNSAVRTLLRVLEEKGHVRHEAEGKRYLYRPTETPQSAAQSALRQVLHTFFGGSMASAVRTFLSDDEADVSEEEITRLSVLVEQARQSEATETSAAETEESAPQ